MAPADAFSKKYDWWIKYTFYCLLKMHHSHAGENMKTLRNEMVDKFPYFAIKDKDLENAIICVSNIFPVNIKIVEYRLISCVVLLTTLKVLYIMQIRLQI